MEDIDDLLTFITSQPPEFINALISDSKTCRTYIRLLPELSQQVLFRLLLLPEGCPLEIIQKWAPAHYLDLHKHSLLKLKESGLIKQSEKRGKIWISVIDQVKNVLMHSYGQNISESNDDLHSENKLKFSGPSLFNTSEDKDKKPIKVIKEKIDESILDDWSIERLNSILEFML